MWKITTLPSRKKPIGCKWVFTIKYKSIRSIERYKARLLAKGYTQTLGIDYCKTFALVLKVSIVHIVIVVVGALGQPYIN